MRSFIYVAVLLSLLFSCGESKGDSIMILKGDVKGLKKGKLYLQKIMDSVLVTLDSLEVSGSGDFQFETELESPEIFYLYLDKKDNNTINDRITFFGEPGEITINTTWNTFDIGAKIIGSETHKKLEEYRKVMSRFNSKNLELLQRATNDESSLDSLQTDSIQRLIDKNVQRGYVFAVNFALNNKDSYVAPYIALNEIPDANVKYLDSIYNSLHVEVAKSKYGNELKSYLDQKRGN